MLKDINKSGKPFVFRYRPDNNFTLDEIKDSYIYFQKRELLNDPFDSTPELIDLKNVEIEKLIRIFNKFVGKEETKLIEKKFTHKQLEQIIHSSLPSFINKHGIACFSMLPGVNMPLLANYANNHKGLYLQYNIENDSDFFNGITFMNYQNELEKISINLLQNEEDIYKVFFLKQENWSYEKELRLVKQEFGKYTVKREALRNIICGYNCSDEYIEKVIESNIENRHVNVWRMEKPTQHNRLKLDLII